MDPAVERSPRVLVSGSNGLVARYLLPRLSAEGKQVIRLRRRRVSQRKRSVFWDPQDGTIEAEKLEHLDTVYHFAGEPIAGRWTPERKRAIRDSRIDGTRLLCEALARAPLKPRTLICASAIGYYGDRGDEVLDESSSCGDDFLAEVCRDWEAACQPAREAGIRVVNARFGIILSANGGALAKMLPAFRCGLGGPLGSGQQYMSWIAAQDAIDILLHLAKNRSFNGPVNVVSPTPVRNAEFTRYLGRALRRPTLLRAPASALRFIFGEMADACLLSSCCVLPKKLLDSGYEFYYEDVALALRNAMRNK